jgi:hypothetical protein
MAKDQTVMSYLFGSLSKKTFMRVSSSKTATAL